MSVGCYHLMPENSMEINQIAEGYIEKKTHNLQGLAEVIMNVKVTMGKHGLDESRKSKWRNKKNTRRKEAMNQRIER